MRGMKEKIAAQTHRDRLEIVFDEYAATSPHFTIVQDSVSDRKYWVEI